MNLVRLLFGQDIFISYSRADAITYAAALANKLSQRGFACFLDQWGSEPGAQIPGRVMRTLRRSSMLVVVGSPRGAASEAVEHEVDSFVHTGRAIVPISIDGALETGRWYSHIKGASISTESAEQLQKGEPSEHVLRRIESSFLFTKRNARVRNGFIAAGIGLLLLLGIAAWRQHAANVATQSARAAQMQAKAALAQAKDAQQMAMARARDAQEASDRAEKNAKIAKQQQAIAQTQSMRAYSQQQLADERAKRARSLELAAAARAAYETEPDLGALLAMESFSTADTFEARRALLGALAHRPLLESVLDHRPARHVWFSSDGKSIAADQEDALAIWPASGSVRRPRTITSKDVRWKDVSANFLVAAGARWSDQTVHVQSLDAGAKPLVFKYPHGEVESLVVSPDGAMLATGSQDGVVALWDAKSGNAMGEPLTASNQSGSVVWPVTVMTFSADGKMLHWRTSDGERRTIDVASREPVPWQPEQFTAYFAIAADGAKTAYIDSEGSLSMARLHQGKLEGQRKLIDRGSFGSVAISADGELIAAGTMNGIVHLFEDGSPRSAVKAHDGEVRSLAFSPDGTRLVSSAADGTLLWRTRHASLHRQVTFLDWLARRDTTLRFTRDGKRILVTELDSIHVIDAERAVADGLPIKCGEARLSGLAVHPDGRTIAAGDFRHRLFFADLRTRRCTEREKAGSVVLTNRNWVTALAFSPDGKRLVSGDTEGALVLSNIGPKTLRSTWLREPDNNADRVNTIAWSGDALHVGGDDQLWFTSGRKPRELPMRLRVTALSADGRLVAGGSEDRVYIWDAATRREIAQFAEEGDDDPVTALALSRNGALLAVARLSGRLSLLDVVEERWIGDLPLPAGETAPVTTMDFSPVTERLAATVGQAVLIWDLDPKLWLRRAAELANRKLSDVERKRYLRDQ